jgi:rod shape determining protein RodA
VNARITRLRDFDPLLLLAALGLTAMGAMLIYSGSLTAFGRPDAYDFSHPVMRQALFAIVAVAASLVFAVMDYRALGTLSVGLYIASIAALVFVLIAGDETYGSRRWITIGGTQVQPSEIAKLVVIIALAKYLSDQHHAIGTLRVFLTSLAIAAVPAVLVLMEPDLGSAVIFGAIWLGMVAVAGARPLHLGGLLAIAVVLVPFVFMLFAADYQRDRIDLWIHNDHDPLGESFQIENGLVAIGSGGVFGKGFTDGTQTQLDYLQTKTTDYVFSVLGEELGLIGALALFGLFVLLLFRSLRVASLSRDLFGRLLATGMVIFILLQTFINIGVNLGLLPVTGIPLPFVSQGGSSLVSLFVGLGILQSILIRHRRFSFKTFYEG